MKAKQFRPINDAELELAHRVSMSVEERDELFDALVAYVKQGSFTTCILAISDSMDGAYVMTGCAKKAPEDFDKPEHAERIAFRRAVEGMFTSSL